MLQLKNIKKDYVAANNTVRALKGVSLRFRKNEFVSILGASGCGKTTLLNIIGGLDHYTSGDLVINGISTKDYKDRDWDVYRNHRIGFVFQSYNLIPHQTVLGNVELALTIAGLSKAERRRRAEEALCKVGLGAELKKRPNQLSGGQMQRVAIARALVNNPEILLADEPTGALDTTTSIQIMELIREIAGERLVIMVTHNPEIAEEYSSRIVRLQDGLVISDSNPYYGEDEGVQLKQVEAHEVPKNAKVETRLHRTIACPYCGETVTVETDGAIVEGNCTCPHCNSLFRIGKKVKYYKKPEEQPVLTRKQRRAMEKANKAAAKASRKKEQKERSSMSFKTSLGLSARNLLSKKGRTALTSIAGSIGIISVCLVLALSNGFNNYILKTQEDMLSAYPITISKNSVNLNNIADKMTSISDLPDMDRLDDKVYVNSVLSNLAQGMTLVNDLSRGEGSYIEYIESMDESMYAAMQYDYGMNVFSKIYTSVTLGGVGEDAPETEEFRSLSSIKQTYKTKLSLMNAEYAQIDYLVDFLPSVIGKIPDTQDMSKANCLAYVQSQYDKLAGEWPTQANDAVLVIGGNNEMFDLTLAQLGFISEKDFLELFDEEKQTSLDVDFDTILQKQYFLANNDTVYTASEPKAAYAYEDDGIFTKTEFESNLQDSTKGRQIKISAILRLKDDLSYGCLSNGLNITEQLELDYIQENKDSAVAKTIVDGFTPGTEELFGIKLYARPACAEVAEYYRRIDGNVGQVAVSGAYYLLDPTSALQTVGASDDISGISIYTSTFDSKDALVAYLDAWNAQFDENVEEEKARMVNYSDTVATLTMLIGGILNAITYVLVAFTSISLVVSSVMIGIITYVSVVERTKEIGVLRSLGARKKDIKNLFNAETFIIGLTSGLFGVAVCYGLCVIVNAILSSLTGIATLASLPITSAAIMVCISVALTLISGLIPANAAAKKDPVIALRTE